MFRLLFHKERHSVWNPYDYLCTTDIKLNYIYNGNCLFDLSYHKQRIEYAISDSIMRMLLIHDWQTNTIETDIYSLLVIIRLYFFKKISIIGNWIWYVSLIGQIESIWIFFHSYVWSMKIEFFLFSFVFFFSCLSHSTNIQLIDQHSVKY
jgi:hypothetical protein